MTMKEELIEKIKNRTLTMGVCGLGYVGLPLAVDKAKHGFHTIGFDVQQEKVDMVNAGKNYIGDVVNSDLEELVSSGMLSATTDFSRVCDVDFIAICVPTPLDKHQQPDISYVRDSTIAIAKHLTRGSIVVLESTTYPGTTEAAASSAGRTSIWASLPSASIRAISSTRPAIPPRLWVPSAPTPWRSSPWCTAPSWREM